MPSIPYPMKPDRAESLADLEAVRKTLAGEPEAFREIVERYTPVLFPLCRRLAGSDEEAEDAVQEILLRAFRGLPSFNPSRSFFPWLYTLALNWLRSSWRRRQRRPPSLSSFRIEERPDPRPDPAERAVGAEAERLVRDAIDRLPLRYRTVFALRHFQGLDIEEIAAALGIPAGTVKTRLHRARKRVADAIA